MIDYMLVFKGLLAALSGYSDSDQAGDYNTWKSTSGYIFNIGSAVISQSLKLQLTVTLLLYKAEYIGQINTIKEAVWLQQLLNKIQLKAANKAQAIIIYCNNQGAIALVKNP